MAHCGFKWCLDGKHLKLHWLLSTTLRCRNTIFYLGQQRIYKQITEPACSTPESLLVTLDVSLLYTNIRHYQWIVACEEALNSRKLPVPPTTDICHLIWLILFTNLFTFNQKHYLQIQDTALGTRMAPSYTNLFMGKLELDFLLTQSRKPRVWWRYIGDIFVISTHDEPSLRTFTKS